MRFVPVLPKVLFGLLLLLLPATVAHALPWNSEEIAATPEAAFFDSMVGTLRSGDYDGIRKAFVPAVGAAAGDGVLRKMAETFPEGPPVSKRFIGWQSASLNGKRTLEITAEYEYPGRWVLVRERFKGEPPDMKLLGFRIDPLAQSLEATHAFTFAGKGPVHYLFLAGLAVFPLFSIYAFVVCLRTRGLKRKWLWAVVTLLGTFSVSLDWTSGELYFSRLLSLQILGVGLIRSGDAAPWIITLAPPVGAILFLIKRKKLIAASVPPASPDDVVSAPVL